MHLDEDLGRIHAISLLQKDTDVNNSNTNATDIDSEDAKEAQEAVGKLLFDTRKSQGLEVSDVARVLRISQKYLEAIEDGRNSDLPGTAYAIGFVRSYAEHLNLDGAEIVRRYKDEDKALGDKTQLSFPKPIPEGGVPGAAVLGLGVVIALVAYGVWYYNSNSDDVVVARVDPVPEHMAATPEVKVVSETPKAFVKIETPKPVVDEKVVAAVEAVKEKVAAVKAAKPVEVIQKAVDEMPAADRTVEKEAIADVEQVEVVKVEEAVEAVVEVSAVEKEPVDLGPSRVTVRALANSWIQVRDRKINRLLFTRLLREGDEYEVPNRAGLYLMTGNAGALEILVDGEKAPSIGGIGDVRRDVELDPDKLKSGSAVTD